MGRLIADPDGNPPAGFVELNAFFAQPLSAESGASIVRNDYRIGTVIPASDAPGRVIAVLDRELGTLGDPLFDLCYFRAGYPAPGEPLTSTGRIATAVLETGYPTRVESSQRCSAATGVEVSNLSWCIALAS